MYNIYIIGRDKFGILSMKIDVPGLPVGSRMIRSNYGFIR